MMFAFKTQILTYIYILLGVLIILFYVYIRELLHNCICGVKICVYVYYGQARMFVMPRCAYASEVYGI